jgi:prepilin-type N-terminal cleavage/methylation domain-containing protein
MSGLKIYFTKYRLETSGFTLIELLIAVFLAAVVASAAMGIYIAQQKQSIVQDEETNMQADIRAAAVELTSKIRMAGYNVPEGIPKLEASNTNPDTITITFDSGGFEDVTIEHPMPQPSSELRCDGHDISALRDGDWVFIYDPFTESGEFFLVTEVRAAPAQIQHTVQILYRQLRSRSSQPDLLDTPDRAAGFRGEHYRPEFPVHSCRRAGGRCFSRRGHDSRGCYRSRRPYRKA